MNGETWRKFPFEITLSDARGSIREGGIEFTGFVVLMKRENRDAYTGDAALTAGVTQFRARVY